MPWRCADLEKLLAREPGQAGVYLFQTRPGPRGALCWPRAHPHQLPSGRTPSTPEGCSRPPHSPFPSISQHRARKTSPHSSARVPSLHHPVCVEGGLGCSEGPQAITVQPLRDLRPGAGERGTTGPCSLGSRHTAPPLSDFSLSCSPIGGIPRVGSGAPGIWATGSKQQAPGAPVSPQALATWFHLVPR